MAQAFKTLINPQTVQRLAQRLLALWPAFDAPRFTRLASKGRRTLVKQGHARVLAAWGLGAAFRGSASLVVTPERIVLGDGLQLALQLHSRAAKPQKLVVDYAVHHVKANGSSSQKVFKG